jgi:beta-lactamase regulating signal transducer with metallopeptidase domain
MMEALEHVATLWWGWMGPMILQSSLLIIVIGAIDVVGRRLLWPQVRYALWLLVLLKLLLPPAWSLPTGIVPQLERQIAARVVLPWRQQPAAHPAGESAAEMTAAGRPAAGTPVAGQPAASNADAASVPSPGKPIAPGVTPATPAVATPARSPSWRAWAMLVWAAGLLAFAILLAVRVAALRRWHDREREGLTIPPWYHQLLVETAGRLGVGRLPAIVFSDRLLSPAVCGVAHPTMYLPREYLDRLSPEEAEHVLLHEMAHIKRGDLWLHGVGLLVQIVYWFNPLVALARRRTQHVREICTDLTVASVLRERTSGYRATLVATARRLLTESAAPGLGLLGVFEEPFRLVARLRWLEKPTWEWGRPARVIALLVAGGMIAFVLPMAGGAPASLDQSAAAPSRGAGAAGGTGEAQRFAADGPVIGEADLYVRSETRRDNYLLGFKVETKPQGIAELWISGRRLAQREGAATIIIDLEDSTLTYVSHADQSYVVADLPLDVERFMTPELLAWRRANLTAGRVQPTGREQRLLGRPSQEFLVQSWGVGATAPPVEFNVWASTDVPHDLALFREFLKWLRVIHGRTEEYTRSLQQIQGLQMRLEREFRKFPFKSRIVDEIVAIDLVEVKPSVFAPPEGYVRKERLSRL